MGHNTRCTLRPPPLLSCPPEGQEEEEEVPGCPAQGEQSLKVETFYVLYKSVSVQKVPTAPETNLHKSHKSCLQYKSYPYT